MYVDWNGREQEDAEMDNMRERAPKRAANPCGRMVEPDHAYEVWRDNDGWTWYVLKKYQTPDQEAKNPNARWFCLVVTPFSPRGDRGDVYVRGIKSQPGVHKLSINPKTDRRIG